MEALLIINKDEFIKAYEYGKESAAKESPSTYPCILVKTQALGGVGGEYIEHSVYFFPQEIKNHDDYFQGFCAALPIEE